MTLPQNLSKMRSHLAHGVIVLMLVVTGIQGQRIFTQLTQGAGTQAESSPLPALVPTSQVPTMSQTQPAPSPTLLVLDDLDSTCSARWKGNCWASLARIAVNNPRSKRFRVTSNESAGSAHESFEAYYDRKKQEIRTRYRFSDSNGDSGLIRQSYKKVDDNLLRGFLAKFPSALEESSPETDREFYPFFTSKGGHIEDLPPIPDEQK